MTKDETEIGTCYKLNFCWYIDNETKVVNMIITFKQWKEHHRQHVDDNTKCDKTARKLQSLTTQEASLMDKGRKWKGIRGGEGRDGERGIGRGGRWWGQDDSFKAMEAADHSDMRSLIKLHWITAFAPMQYGHDCLRSQQTRVGYGGVLVPKAIISMIIMTLVKLSHWL